MKKSEELKSRMDKVLELKSRYQCLEELYEFVVESWGFVEER